MKRVDSMSKRVAIYYDSISSGRNDGAPVFSWNVLKTQMPGVDVTHLVPYGDVSDFGRFDWNLWVDWGEDGLGGILNYKVWDELPERCAYWASDTHLGYDYRLHRARQAAHAFCMQKRAVEEFGRDGVRAEWLPHAVEPTVYFPSTFPEKKYDLCFVGHINAENRVDALDRMFREFPNFWFGQRLFEGAAEVFSRSKVVFNISIKDDVNMRVFETLATRSFLLTNEIPTLGELFEDGKHLVTYRTLDEAVEKARYYMEHEAERERIAEAGYREVLAKHTYKHRIERIAEVMAHA